MPSSGSGSRKSCVRTRSGEPLGRSSPPAFLKSPTSSFFLVSTLIAGSPASRAALTVALICRNCASRSGWEAPSLVFAFACRLYPSCRKSGATERAEISWPWARNSAARLRRLFAVQRNGCSGSPRDSPSSSRSRSASSVGSVSVSGLRPAPGRRTRPAPGDSPDASSTRPRRIVEGAIPVARATAAVPPRPSAVASAAAHSRSARSSSSPASSLNRSPIAASSATQPGFSAEAQHHPPSRSIIYARALRSRTSSTASRASSDARRSRGSF